MTDSFKEVTHTSYFSKIKNAIVGVGFGLVLFVGAFPLLFWNEGRAVNTYLSLKEGASSVVELTTEEVDPRNNNKLIHISNQAKTEENVSDSLYNISINAIKLLRDVEMFQWEESKSSRSKKKIGGGSKTVTTYTYNKRWNSRAVNSSRFKKRQSHSNPTTFPINSSQSVAKKVYVGEFLLSSNLVGKINNYSDYNVEDITNPRKLDGVETQLHGNYIYYGNSPVDPQIGDVRVRFKVIHPQLVSVIAKQVGNNLVSYDTSFGKKIQLLVTGRKSAKEMFDAEQASNTMWTWIIRAGGLLMMFFGMCLILGPISVLGDIIPFIGDILGIGTGIIAFCVTAPLSFLVIAIAWFTYRPIMGSLLIAIGIGLALFIFSKKKRKIKSEPRKKVHKTKVKKDRKMEVRPEQKIQSTPVSSSHKQKESASINLDDDMDKYSKVSKSSIPEEKVEKKIENKIETSKYTKYYVYGKNKKFGPYSIEKLKVYLKDGKVRLTTPCKEKGGENKIRVKDIPGIKSPA